MKNLMRYSLETLKNLFSERVFDVHDMRKEISRIWYEEFEFCGCGNPNEVLETIQHILTERSKSQLLDHEFLLYLYLLDLHGFLEHGGGIHGSWPTEKGKILLWFLSFFDLDDFDLVEDYA